MDIKVDWVIEASVLKEWPCSVGNAYFHEKPYAENIEMENTGKNRN